MKKIILLFIISLLFTSCNQEEENTNQLKGLVTEKAMVVSARVEASRIGTEILKKGGNAFDAMMATELALAVAYPYAGNIGGGGFMVYRKNDGEIGALDYREKAPLAATRDMYLDKEGNIISLKVKNHIYEILTQEAQTKEKAESFIKEITDISKREELLSKLE